MKKGYVTPVLTEYGSMVDLTLGQGGTKPDLLIGTFGLVNNACDASGTTVVACIVISASV